MTTGISQLLDKKAEDIIQESDLDGDGKVTKDEFIEFMHKNDKRTTKIFTELDTDRDGILTVSDIINHEELRHLDLRNAILNLIYLHPNSVLESGTFVFNKLSFIGGRYESRKK